MIKKFVAYLITCVAIIAPAAWLIFFYFNPQADATYSIPIAHFYIVTFTTFSAAVLSILLLSSLGAEAKPRHLLAAAAFAVIGGIFFSHALATPGAIIDHAHPAISWSAWLTLFGSGVLFAIAGLDSARSRPNWLPVRPLIVIAFLAVVGYSAVAGFAPALLTQLESAGNPWMRDAIFYISLALWIFAAARLAFIWWQTRSRIDATLAVVAVWLGTATVSMHRFAVWHYGWWVYHVTLLMAFLVASFIFAAEYEQVRQFRLVRYYLALSLVVTAFLALVASAFFTQFSYNNLVSEIESASSALAENVSHHLSQNLTDVTAPEDLEQLPGRSGTRGAFARAIEEMPIVHLILYRPNGISAYATELEWIDVRVVDTAAFDRALKGEVMAIIREPSAAVASGHGPASSFHLILTYVPFYPSDKVTTVVATPRLSKGGGGNDPYASDAEAPAATPAPTATPAPAPAASQVARKPIGVLMTVQEVPSLQLTTIDARITGLLTAAVSMGLLFIALFIVVGRADGIITLRTKELRAVSARLKTYSEWLLGKELLERLLEDPNALSLIRKERTVVFMDIRGFTRWSEARTPEEVVSMLNRYYNAIEQAMTKHGAIKFKFAADEAMAVFSEAVIAARAAKEMFDDVDKVLSPQDLGARVGVHTGPLVEGLLGSMDVKFYDVIGDTVNTAKRIESAAARREILVSEATRHALGTTAKFGEPHQIAAKGKEDPLTVYPLN